MVYRTFESMPFTLSVKDVADTLDIGLNRAYALVNDGELHSLRIGNKIRIPRDSFIAFVLGDSASA